jgi:diguanylate cyclase (GGDEF)-like protein
VEPPQRLPAASARVAQDRALRTREDRGVSVQQDSNGSAALARLAARLERADRFWLLLVCGLLLAAITAVDVSVDPLVALPVFYLLPVLFAAAREAPLGIGMAFVSVTAWFCVDAFRANGLFDSLAIPLVNTALRLSLFLVVVGLVSALRGRLRVEVELGRRDSLTGLVNTRAFYEAGEAARRAQARTGRPMTLAYVDLDDFKKVNDRLGHAAGDDVLRWVSGLLAEAVREVDTVGRLGGDEFGILMPETDAEEAAAVLDRLRRRLVEAPSAGRGVPGPRGAVGALAGLGVSIGAATFDRPTATVDAMVAAADRAMYEVKRSGKNSVRFE